MFVTVGRSCATDPQDAVAEATAHFDLSQTCFVLAFVPHGTDHDALARALDTRLQGVPAFGCTSAGQITLEGYETDALLLIAFPKSHFRCASVMFSPLKPLSIPAITAKTEQHITRFPHTAGWNRFALVFADGLSKQEDLLASTLEIVLEGLPIFGGSAGDGMAFRETFVLHHGTFHSNAALLLVLETNLEFEGVSFDHFMPSDVQLIITEANPEERIVYEINGAPAASEYARLVGCAVEDLNPRIFAENPMLVEHRDNHYVRAVSDATPDLALRFLAAIDDGLIMTLGRGKEVIQTLEAGLNVTANNKQPDFILGFDCALRRLELEQKGLDRHASDLFQQRRVIGFNTYGEQHRGLHMNQTFLGVAFFEPEWRLVT